MHIEIEIVIGPNNPDEMEPKPKTKPINVLTCMLFVHPHNQKNNLNTSELQKFALKLQSQIVFIDKLAKTVYNPISYIMQWSKTVSRKYR